MFNIFAQTLHTATRTNDIWNLEDTYPVYDHRTHAQKRRDQAERRRLLRNVGFM